MRDICNTSIIKIYLKSYFLPDDDLLQNKFDKIKIQSHSKIALFHSPHNIPLKEREVELQRASVADANASWYAWGHPPSRVKAEQELKTSELETSVPVQGS